MPRFFISHEAIQENSILVTGENERHLKKVLRAKSGEEITLCDSENQMDYHCKIISFGEDGVFTEIIHKTPCQAESDVKITLYQGIPKGDKMEWILQKAVELGVSKVVPVEMARCVAKLDKKEDKKIQRWQKIAEAAAKQSGRGKIPQVGTVLRFQTAVEEALQLDGAILPYENEEKTGIREFCTDFTGKSIGVFIGPEGGFAAKEVELAKKSGILPITLGRRILRTETAGMAAILLLLHELER